ncbi:hypothetical protein C8R47DRAFT_1315968 [Mycena vitilis]|nr:hypothetical protein C8R47DRAFT_1315968 [Mycena vitilis]
MSQEVGLDEIFTALSQTYHICITLDQEVKYIWKERWSLPKVLYLFCRYYGLLDLMFVALVATHEGPSVEVLPLIYSLKTPSCHVYYGIYDIGPVLLITALNVLFILRIHALYNRSLKMLACLAVLFLLEFVTGLVLTVVVTADTIRNASEAPRGVYWPGCVTTVSSFSELVAWIPAIFVSSMFFVLTMIKFVVVFRTGHSEWSLKKLRECKSYSPILAAFVRDGTVFFFLIFSAVLVNTIATLLFKGPFMGLVLPWLTATYSFSASRLVLNIRSAAVLDNPTTVTESFSLDFRRPVMQDSVDTDEGET